MPSGISWNGSGRDSSLSGAAGSEPDHFQAVWTAASLRVELRARLAARGWQQADRDDLTQEALGIAWQRWLSMAAKGRSPEHCLERFARSCVASALRGRTVARRGQGRCFLAPHLARVHGRCRVRVEVEELGATHRELPRPTRLANRRLAQPCLVDHGTSTPADWAAFRLDFRSWLRARDRSERRAVFLFVRGYRRAEVCQRVRVGLTTLSDWRGAWRAHWTALERA